MSAEIQSHTSFISYQMQEVHQVNEGEQSQSCEQSRQANCQVNQGVPLSMKQVRLQSPYMTR